MTDQPDRYLLPAPIAHGGDIDGVAGHYGIPAGDWVDLSTGINPHAYPLPDIPATAWHRLPGRAAEDRLRAAARQYYGIADRTDICAIPGTQSVLPLLPHILPPGQVDILSPTYGEHAHCWSQTTYTSAGANIDASTNPLNARTDRTVRNHRKLREIHSMTEIDTDTKIAIIVNPNNPDGKRYNVIELLDLAETLRNRGGFLILDEAFADEDPARSCAPSLPEDGLIILRSFGKFFGLAGLRLGFVIAPPVICESLRRHLGPWAVNGPALHLGARALADIDWQQQARTRLAQTSDRLRHLLTRTGLEIIGGTHLFCLTHDPAAPALYDHLCRDGILCRFFEDRPGYLRFGLPGPDAHWQRLEKSLLAWSERAEMQITN